MLKKEGAMINSVIRELVEQGADAALLDVLRQGLRGRTEMEIRWARS